MAELIEHFSLEGLSKSPAVFDYDKLGWINGEYLKAMSDEDFAKMARPFVGELPDYLEQSWTHLASLLKTRIQRLGDLPQEIAFLCEQPAFDAELYVNKRNKVTPEKAAELLPGMMALLEEVPESDWNNDSRRLVILSVAIGRNSGLELHLFSAQVNKQKEFRRGVRSPRLAHNQKIVGSNPTGTTPGECCKSAQAGPLQGARYLANSPWASLVCRLFWIQETGGSNPPGLTKFRYLNGRESAYA